VTWAPDGPKLPLESCPSPVVQPVGASAAQETRDAKAIATAFFVRGRAAEGSESEWDGRRISGEIVKSISSTSETFRWNWEGTRLRVASVFEEANDSTGPALRGMRQQRSRIRDHTQGSRPIAMI